MDETKGMGGCLETLTLDMSIGIPRVVMAVIVWLLDLQLPMQSVPITTDVVGSTPAQGEVYNIMFGGFLHQ